MKRAVRLLALFVPAFLSGCSWFSGGVGVLWTDRPELTIYAEVFNSTQSYYRIEVVYKANPGAALLDARRPPDLAVGKGLASVPIVGRFSPLDQILNRGQVNPALFYKNLLRTGRYEGRQLLLPVAFDLPVFVSAAEDQDIAQKGTLLSLDDIKQLATAFNEKGSDTFRVMAFSPLWDPDFLEGAAAGLGADFHQNSRGDLAWNDQKLAETVSYLHDWVESVDGGSQAALDFSEKYLYDPFESLLQTGRILCYSMSLSEFLEVPEEKRSGLEFQWIAQGGRVSASGDILYAGVPRRARAKNAAYAFLDWLFRQDTQRELLDTLRGEHVKSFGIAGGLSALPAVNATEMPRIYPALAGRVPTTDSLVFPRSLPPDWPSIKSDVVVPWIENQILKPDPNQKLEDRLSAWRLQRPLM